MFKIKILETLIALLKIVPFANISNYKSNKCNINGSKNTVFRSSSF
jgi:predicted small integral membrane protein